MRPNFQSRSFRGSPFPLSFRTQRGICLSANAKQRIPRRSVPRNDKIVAICCLALTFTLAAHAQSLRQEADRIGILFGAAVNHRYLDQPAYTETLAREFNMIEAEDAMKWTATRPDANTFDFTAGDALVAFAQAHNMKVRGHNLLWGIHNPKWLDDAHYTPEQLSALMQQHITRVVEHYRGKVFAWDVVNEAFGEFGEVRDSIWYNKPGIGLAGKGAAYVEQAFRWAHAADPQALLFYNEAGADEINRKSDAMFAMVKDFKRRGVPIDGVGLQMHIFDPYVDAKSVAANMKRFVKLGVQVHITEMDVALPVDSAGNLRDPNDLARQAQIYRWAATACLRQRGCTAFQTWGFTDKYSWIPRYTHGTKGDALILDREYLPKPSYEALHEVFAAQRAR